MNPTLHMGEVVWVNKLKTGNPLPIVRFPFYSLDNVNISYKLRHRLPSRGEIVAIRYPGLFLNKSDVYFVKRVLALPGDSYEIKNGNFYRNGNSVIEPYLAKSQYTDPIPLSGNTPVVYPPWDRFPMSDELLRSSQFGAPVKGIVPGDGVYVLGDNRLRSRDSRSIGFIPIRFIVGVVVP